MFFARAGGGNVIGYARGKTLQTQALKKGGYDSSDRVVSLLEEGAGAMPRYGQWTKKSGAVVPARLNDQELHDVADYVLKRAAQNWQ